MNSWLAAFLFFLPAAIANATPVIANKVPLLKNWKTPLDLHKTWRGQRLLGTNKSWRGLVTGTLFGGLTALLVGALTSVSDPSLSTFLLGSVIGFGALVGDAVESFFKRQRGIGAGRSWFPFDQIDYIIGGLVFVYPITRLPLGTIAMIFITFFGLHLLGAYVGYLTGLKDKPI